MNIRCSKNTEISYSFANYKEVDGELAPYIDNSGLIAVDTNASNCSSTYSASDPTDAPIVPKH
jgi:hypothetical protein